MATLVANIVEPDDTAFHQSLHCLPLDIIHLLRKKYKSFHWRSSHYTVTHVRIKNSNIQGRSPKVVKVIFHTIRNCLKESLFDFFRFDFLRLINNISVIKGMVFLG